MPVKSHCLLALVLTGTLALGSVLAGPLPRAKRHAQRMQCVNNICEPFPPLNISTNNVAP
jgi:hypothetical protein